MCPGPDPALHMSAKLLLAFGWGFCVWPGRERPVQKSRSCCRCRSSSSQVFQLPHRGEGSFSPCLPGQSINCPTLVASWEGKLGAAWLEACPALVTCLGIHARPAPEAVCHPSCVGRSGLCPWASVQLALMLVAPPLSAAGSGPCLCFIPSVVRLW